MELKAAYGMRNSLSHGYFRVDPVLVWGTLQTEELYQTVAERPQAECVAAKLLFSTIIHANLTNENAFRQQAPHHPRAAAAFRQSHQKIDRSEPTKTAPSSAARQNFSAPSYQNVSRETFWYDRSRRKRAPSCGFARIDALRQVCVLALSSSLCAPPLFGIASP